MGKPSAPPSPDYTGAAQAQGAANVEAARTTAKLSNPNVITPYGKQFVTYEGDVPTVETELNPVQNEAILNQMYAQRGLAQTANEQTANVRNLLGTPFSFSGTPQGQLDLSNVAKMPVNAGTTAQQAILSRLEPAIARRRQATETQLINQGLRPGGEAYDNAINLLGQQENDELQQAALQGIGVDMGANQQGFNQALQGGQFGNTALQQQLAQALQQRDLPINEITALLSGSQVQNPQFPGYQGATAAPAPLFAGTQAQGAWDQNIYNQQVAQRNAMMGGLFNLGGAATGGLFGLFK